MPRNIGGVAVSCSSTTTDFNTPTPPANDNCTAAIGLTMNPTNTLTITTSFTTALATQSFIGCTGSADDDVWFYFDATTVRHNIAVSSSLAADLVHEVFNGTCSGSVTSMYCSDADASVGECFVPGQRYLVRVYTHGNASNSGTVTIGVGTSSAASLDATCLTATQICAPFSFTAGVNQPSGGAGCGANYSCLTTTPNPEYHWLQITNTGTLDYTLSSTAGDVDFALWRISGVPVPSSSCGGSQIINCGSSLGTPIACSYSIFATELINVAVTPGYYLLLATNFANAPGVVSLVANVGNTAAVGCPCVISELTATASACNTTNNLYVINGSVTYNSAAPTSGTLTIVDNNGSLVSYNFPFPSSPISYSIVGNTSDGAVHTVQAIFSSNPSCMRCVSYTAPIACCVAPTPTLLNISDAGCGYTFDLQASGGSGPPFEWSTSHTFSPLMSSIVGINFPLGLGTETYYVRTVGQLCSSSIVVTDSSVANNITNGNCMTCYVADGLTRTFYDASNNIIATISDPLGSTNLATTTACAFVEASNVMFNGQDYMRRHFDIDVTNNGPATVSIYLSPADVSNLISASEDDTAAGYGRFNSMADLCLTAYDGGSESPTSNTSATLIPHGALTISGPVAPNDYYVVSFPVSGFSGFYCHACNPLNTPLPVHYISFDGYHAQSHNMLRWITASEVNNHFFELQRSVDATDWQKIARVDGAGTASTSNSYSFKDNYLEQSYYYYRLKQVDFDGTFHYSNIVYLAGDEISVNNIYPNPSQSIVHYSVASNEEADIVVKIINVAGEVVLEEPSRVYKGANNLLLNVSGIASGAYCLQVINGSTGLRISNTFIKE